MFILLALLSDLYKWCIFIAATADTDNYDYDIIYALMKKRLTYVFASIMVFNVAAFGILITGFMLSGNRGSTWTEVFRDYISLAFIILLIAYVIILSMLIRRLKSRFSQYFD